MGSSTLCIVTLDHELNQLSYSNIGDCGLVVIRHIDNDVAGYMRVRNTPRDKREHDLRIAYISQQQLKTFNLPYQLGFSNLPQHKNTFETPADADTASIPVSAFSIFVEIKSISCLRFAWLSDYARGYCGACYGWAF